MFSVITNIYNKKTKGPALMELVHSHRKTEKVFHIYIYIYIYYRGRFTMFTALFLTTLVMPFGKTFLQLIHTL